MKKGAPPDIELSKSYNPLGFAASRNDIKSMEILIKNGANVNDPKHPPLISAIMDSRNFAPSIEPIKMLVENGADVNIVQYGKRPLDYAMTHANREIVKYLKSMGAKPATKEERRAYNEKYNVKPDMLSKLVAANKIESIKEYLESGGDPDEPGALHVAVFWGRNEIAKLLIEKGADVNQEHGDRSPWTPLATLSESKSPEKDKMLEMLLEAGADPEWTDKSGRSILYLFVNDTLGPRSEREEKMMADERGHAYMKAHMRCIEILKERLGVDTVGIMTSKGVKQVDIPTTYGLRVEDIPVKESTAPTTMTTPTTRTTTPVP